MDENEKLEVVDDGAQHLYSNLISFNVNPEEVCLGLGIRDIKNPNVIRVNSFLHLTLPHFLRFAEAVNKQVDLLIDRGIVSREPEQ